MRYLLHDVLENSVKQFGDKVSIKEELGKTITYIELNNLSNKFAHAFSKLKSCIIKNPYIGILSAVHINSIAAVLGCLKIGCAYVPLDESSPEERLKHIVQNLNLDLLVIDPVFYERYKGLLNDSSLKYIVLVDAWNKEVFVESSKIIYFDSVIFESEDNPKDLNQVSDDLAYILHSSGSTGIPKGIMLTHRNARTFVDWMQKEFYLTDQDIIISRAPFKFDLSIFDVFNALKVGATLVCYNWNHKREIPQRHRDYVCLMEREKVTVLYTTPSTFITLMNEGGLENANLKLTRIMYAGESFHVAQLRRLKKMLPDTKIANIYGPTETNIITYYWVSEIPEDMTSIPLGKVVDDTEIMVVSEDLSRICAVNEVGELWCRGGTVTSGYIGLEDKTKECLVKSPFHTYPSYFWRTGDYGFKDHENILHYRGRKDHMVKIKGHRVEIGEIEAAISGLGAFNEFAVVSTMQGGLENKLFCFFCSYSGFNKNVSSYVEFLRVKLPHYMIPSQFIELEILPKTSSGKIDRNRLAEEARRFKEELQNA